MGGGRVVQFPKLCYPSSTMFVPQKHHWATYINKDLYSIILAKLKQMSTDVNLQSKIKKNINKLHFFFFVLKVFTNVSFFI